MLSACVEQRVGPVGPVWLGSAQRAHAQQLGCVHLRCLQAGEHPIMHWDTTRRGRPGFKLDQHEVKLRAIGTPVSHAPICIRAGAEKPVQPQCQIKQVNR